MPKFRVRRLERVEVYAEIEADDEDVALEIFDEFYPGLTSYVGNGGVNKLIGVSASDEIDYGVESLEDQMPSKAEKLA